MTLHILWFRYLEHAFRFWCTEENAKYFVKYTPSSCEFLHTWGGDNFIARFFIRLPRTFFGWIAPTHPIYSSCVFFPFGKWANFMSMAPKAFQIVLRKPSTFQTAWYNFRMNPLNFWAVWKFGHIFYEIVPIKNLISCYVRWVMCLFTVSNE